MINPDSILMHIAEEAERLPDSIRRRIAEHRTRLCRQRLWSYVFDHDIPRNTPFTIHTAFGPITATSVREFKTKRARLPYRRHPAGPIKPSQNL